MKLQIFSVYDSAAECFMTPFFLSTVGQAMRGFADAVNEADHAMKRHPEDYTLFHLGEWHPGEGSIHMMTAPVKIGTALNCVLDES